MNLFVTLSPPRILVAESIYEKTFFLSVFIWVITLELTENTLHKIVTKAGFNIVSSEYCKDTEFIFALYEKSKERNVNYKYSYLNEVKKIKKIYRYDNTRYAITKMLKSTGLYSILLPLRKNILKILNLES